MLNLSFLAPKLPPLHNAMERPQWWLPGNGESLRPENSTSRLFLGVQRIVSHCLPAAGGEQREGRSPWGAAHPCFQPQASAFSRRHRKKRQNACLYWWPQPSGACHVLVVATLSKS